MVDLGGKDRGNISLPPRLQSPDVFDPNYVEDENFVPIINMQKAMYDIRIADTEKRIKRLENRNDELLETCEDTETLIDGVDIGTGDHIAYLKKQISTEAEKLQEAKQRIEAIAKLRDEARETHARNTDAVNDEYEKTRAALTSSIKALNAKINTLEDFKDTRVALREKLRILDETKSSKEEEMTRRCDEIDRKFKIDREKLKNEAHSRLLERSTDLQIEISSAIPIPVHRLMRENIVIDNELTQICREGLEMKEKISAMRSGEIVHRKSMKTAERDIKKNVATVMIQRKYLKILKEAHSAMRRDVDNLKKPEEFAQDSYDRLVESARAESMVFDARTRSLEVLLHRVNVEHNRAEYLKNQAKSRRATNEEILYDVKYAVACALKMTETGQDILNMSEVELISHLLDLIVRGRSQIRCLVAPSSESIPRPEKVYVVGDLGFEPEHIDLESLRTGTEFDEAKSPDTSVVEFSTGSVFLPSKISLQPDNEFKNFLRRTSASTEASNTATTSTSAETESKEQTSDSKENFSEVTDSSGGEETIYMSVESLISGSGENKDP